MKTLQQQHAVNTLIKIFIVPVYNTSLLPYYVTIVKNFKVEYFLPLFGKTKQKKIRLTITILPSVKFVRRANCRFMGDDAYLLRLT